MTKRITLVIDVSDPSSAAFYREGWRIDSLRDQLKAVDKTLDVSVFVGKLEDAPESWAYVLYISHHFLEPRTKVPAMRERLSRTLLADEHYALSGHLAHTHGMVGAIDTFARHADARTPGALYVRKDVAAKLKWPLRDHEANDVIVRTADTMKLPLAQLIVTYFDAALGAPQT